jgi:hypothetical protein
MEKAFSAAILIAILAFASAAIVIQSVASGGSLLTPAVLRNDQAVNNAANLVLQGRQIFRFDTFGDQVFWGGQLQINKALAGAQLGGVGPGVSPQTALSVGLKVDVDALPQSLVQQIKNNKVNLTDPATTLALLKLNAVVGVIGFFDSAGNLSSVGITCAICHSTVDDSFAPGIGHRLDGWPNRDLNVGAVINLAPNVTALTNRLGVSESTVRAVLNSWGPGKFDAELLHDGIAFRPDNKTGATLIPPAFGMQGISLHTYTGWGSIPYWNAFVAVTEMQGQGRFYDPRLNNSAKFPLDVKFGTWNITTNNDQVTSKLAPLHAYQLALAAPAPPPGSYNVTAAALGEALFNGKANCAICHTPPLYSEPGWMMHNGSEIGIDNFQANRSPDGLYRTMNLRGMIAHSEGGFFHDGRFATLQDVVLHYNSTFNLKLTTQDVSNLVEFLKSL